MKIKDIQQKGFYKAIDNEHFIIEVLSLDDLTGICGIAEEELKENLKSLFVDVWYHDSDMPYKHDKGVYQSNGTVYKLDAIPEIFENMEFMDDSSYDHKLCGKENMIMRRCERKDIIEKFRVLADAFIDSI